MPQRIKTPITGITTTSVYDEGSCYSLVNLRPKNGALHPVSPRKVVQELSRNYDLVFVHQNNNYKNWIGTTINGSYSSVYWDVRNENPQNITSAILGKINSIQQIGNTISLITDDNIYYLFFQNGNYTFLGEIPQVSVISLRTYSQAHAKYYFVNEYSSGTVTPNNFIDATKGLVNKAMDGLVNGWTDKDGVWHDGYGLMLFDACFIRYAFRLYDGTLTKHSPPILIMPMRHIVGKEEEGNMESIKTISYDFDSSLRNESCVDVYGNIIALNYDLTQIGNDSYDKWQDIIKSVDIFMSAPLGISNIENMRTDMPTTDSPRTLNYNLIKGLSAEALKSVSNTSTFYFIKSIPLGSYRDVLDPEKFPSLDSDSDISKMENLIFQEVMSDDNFSNHKYGAACSYAYNNRLHLANIKTTFFKGFNPDYFLWFNTVVTEDGNYNGFKYADAPGELYTSLLIEVEINTGITNEKVYRSLAFPMIWGIYKMFMSGFISYPDPRAKKITIYRYSGSGWYKVFSQPLEKHNTLNLAYYINDGLKPIIENGPLLVELPDTSKVITLTEPNKIKVSELNNPLNFPNTNVYHTGNGTILAMATNSMLVSDRNFGQYPLYVFTTQGIWTLNVGNGEIVYSTQSAPTSQKTPITTLVCETPKGVVFITKEGLNLINNNADIFISPQIEESPLSLNIEMNNHCDGVIFNPEYRGFEELIQDIRMLIYDPHKDEVIINMISELNYIFNIKNNSFYQSTEKIDLFVGNIYPELYVISDKTLKDYALSENPLTHVSFIIRPILYGTPDIKRMERMILNALLYDVTNPSDGKFSLVMAHYSNDGINFLASKGFPLAEGDKKNFDMGLSSRTKSNQFIFTFAGIVDEKSRFYFIDSIIDKEYTNSKMR